MNKDMRKPQDNTKDITDQSTTRIEDLSPLTEENAIDLEVVEEDPQEIEVILADTTEIVVTPEIADQETGAREDTEEETIAQDLEIVIDLTPETEEDKFINQIFYILERSYSVSSKSCRCKSFR